MGLGEDIGFANGIAIWGAKGKGGDDQSEFEFHEFESEIRQKPVSISTRLNLKTLNTILSGTNHI